MRKKPLSSIMIPSLTLCFSVQLYKNLFTFKVLWGTSFREAINQRRITHISLSKIWILDFLYNLYLRALSSTVAFYSWAPRACVLCSRWFPGPLLGGAVVVEVPPILIFVGLPITLDMNGGDRRYRGQGRLWDLQFLEVSVDRWHGAALAWWRHRLMGKRKWRESSVSGFKKLYNQGGSSSTADNEEHKLTVVTDSITMASERTQNTSLPHR